MQPTRAKKLLEILIYFSKYDHTWHFWAKITVSFFIFQFWAGASLSSAIIRHCFTNQNWLLKWVCFKTKYPESWRQLDFLWLLTKNVVPILSKVSSPNRVRLRIVRLYSINNVFFYKNPFIYPTKHIMFTSSKPASFSDSTRSNIVKSSSVQKCPLRKIEFLDTISFFPYNVNRIQCNMQHISRITNYIAEFVSVDDGNPKHLRGHDSASTLCGLQPILWLGKGVLVTVSCNLSVPMRMAKGRYWRFLGD